ncbi:hypothetical protein [Clostridium sp. C2-6-12]|uniref:hypothetical protein n=1 Tax=Clostridium sp. C2-6-12 TaxID=2698832 RepID=UPI00136C147C|nr:hypothetical protein [Clostridium sp. C2-6-12]
MDRTLTLREGLANKTFMEKVDYIWTYYKLHIIGFLVLFFFVGSYISNLINRQEVYCNITYVGNSINTQELEPIKNTLSDTLLQNPKKQVILFDSVFTDLNTEAGTAMKQKLHVSIAAQQIDLAIVNKKFFEENFSSEMFMNLESLDGFSELSISNHELLKKADSNGNSIYGISVKNLNLLKDVHYTNDDNYLVVISNTEHKDAIMNVLKTFLG